MSSGFERDRLPGVILIKLLWKHVSSVKPDLLLQHAPQWVKNSWQHHCSNILIVTFRNKPYFTKNSPLLNSEGNFTYIIFHLTMILL